MSLLVRFRMIRGTDDQAVASRQPGEFADFPFRIRERFRLAGGQREQPQARLLVVFIHRTRVILVFVLFFFGIALGIGSKIGDLLTVRRPRKSSHAALAFGYGRSFSSVSAHHVNLLLIIAIREKGELLSIGGPARRSFIF